MSNLLYLLRLKKQQFLDSFRILNLRQRNYFVLFVILATISTFGDLIGIFLIGLITSLAVSTLSDGEINSITVSILDFLGLKNTSFEKTVLILGLSTFFFFIFKTTFSLIISKATHEFLARVAISSSTEAFQKFTFSKNERQSFFNQKEVEYAFNEGSQYALIGVAGSFIALFSEFISLAVIFIFLLTVSVYMSFWLLLILAVFGMMMNYTVGKKNAKFSIAHSKINVLGHEQVSDFFRVSRELHVSGKIPKILSHYKSIRKEAAETNARLLFYQTIPKLGLELLIVFSVGGLVVLSVLENDLYTAISQVVIFFAALSRVAPSMLRLQQAFFGIDYNLGHSGKFFEIYGYFLDEKNQRASTNHSSPLKAPVIIEFKDLYFAYSDNKESEKILENINLKISQGEFIALVGPSGVGKSTLCDLILGVLSPTSGSVEINNIEAHQFISANPGVIAFMPQLVNLIKGGVTRNVSLVQDGHSDLEINAALIRAGLEKFVGAKTEFESEDSLLSLSGGEIQRIGLARVLINNPKVLILDEPTSSLDQSNVQVISKTLEECNDNGMTLIVVAHQLSTINVADKIIYMDDKRIKAVGTFDEIRQKIPDFELQAKLQRF